MEKIYRPQSGYVMLVINLVIIILGIISLAIDSECVLNIVVFVMSIVLFIFVSVGLFTLEPNKACVLILFGAYMGTVKQTGFHWVNPFFKKEKVSLRARNFDSQPIKVNDKIGNPIMIGLVLVWKVEDTYKAKFAVDFYDVFVQVQSEAALRKLAGIYPYDNIEDEDADVTLRSGGELVNEKLEQEIIERLQIAGIHVIEARINYIAYAQEIAHAMLKRQQATAIVSARFKIVEGAVSMVEMALEELEEKKIVTLDENQKANMVSNLMVVLCSDKETSPIINAGVDK